MTLEQVNKRLENTPYFAMQGKRSIKFFKRYTFSANDGYRVSKQEVIPYL